MTLQLCLAHFRCSCELSLDAARDQEKSPKWIAPENKLMIQGFEWYVPADQRHWKRLKKALPSLKSAGVDNIWIPPGCKGMSPSGAGYDVYDLYDLGEFHQKDSRATRWGSKEDLQELVLAAQYHDMGIYWDTVLNHKAGADSTEKFPAVKVDPRGTYHFGIRDYPHMRLIMTRSKRCHLQTGDYRRLGRV